jgi:hypothetical protein
MHSDNITKRYESSPPISEIMERVRKGEHMMVRRIRRVSNGRGGSSSICCDDDHHDDEINAKESSYRNHKRI